MAAVAQSGERPELKPLYKVQLCSDVSSNPAYGIMWYENILAAPPVRRNTEISVLFGKKR